MRAEIISVGTEILLGHITDTNAPWLAQHLATLGIDVFHISQVGDNHDRMVETLRSALNRVDIIVVTGGLGPTEDDVTRESIASLVGEQMQVQDNLLKDLKAFFTSRGYEMPERNTKQATLIPSARTLPNPLGTAPGWLVEKNGKIIISMPGVPHEMKRMWEMEALPRLQQKIDSTLFTRILRVAGMGESSVEEKLDSLLHSSNPTIATYAKPDAVDVRISAKASTRDLSISMVEAMEQRARALLGDHVYGTDADTLQSVIGKILTERRLTLATMESCTGGLIASTITDVPGSSLYFRGGLVSYATEIKEEWGVPAEIVQQYGVISRETAEAMATVARKTFHTDIAISVTGVAGPDEQEGKPAGTVHIGLETPWGKEVLSPVFTHAGRTEVKRRATLAALNALRLKLR